MSATSTRVPSDSAVLTVGLVSFCSTLLCHFLSHIISRGFWAKQYALLGDRQLEWHTRVASTIHAILTSGLSAVVLWSDWQQLDGYIGYQSEISAYITIITVGYLAADLLMVLISLTPLTGQKISGPVSTVIHHVVGIMNFGLAVYYRAAYVYALIFILTEASTPFVNNRWFLAALGQTKSNLYILNGIMMVVSFGLVRVVLLPFQSWIVFKHLTTLVQITNVPLGFIAVFGLVVGGSLNSYWFFLMMKGLLKMLQSTKHTKSL